MYYVCIMQYILYVLHLHHKIYHIVYIHYAVIYYLLYHRISIGKLTFSSPPWPAGTSRALQCSTGLHRSAGALLHTRQVLLFSSVTVTPSPPPPLSLRLFLPVKAPVSPVPSLPPPFHLAPEAITELIFSRVPVNSAVSAGLSPTLQARFIPEVKVGD